MASAVNALNSLLRGTSIEDHEEALKIANAAISAPGPSDSIEKLTAQHAKVVALLKLDRFADALRIIASGGDALAARCVLEHAYALYKTGDLDTAATIARSGSAASSRALQHIAAQVAYRDEKFDHAATLYASLATSAAEAEEDTDVRINALAVSAQRSWQGRGQSTLSAGQDAVLDAGRREDLETFETAYNAACAALSRSDVARASILLRRAQQLCEASDELSDEDKRAELLPILIQQAYALTRLGRHDDAAAVQKAIDAAECEGAAKIVAATNTVVAQNAALGTSTSSAVNPYVVQRQLETALPALPTGSDRLFSHQERILRRNQYAIELQCYKFKGVQARTAKQLKKLTAAAGTADADRATAPSTVLPETVDFGIFGAAAKAELQTGKDALRRILPLLEHRPDDIGLLLTAIQLQLHSKNAEAALGLLEAFFKRAETAAPPSSARFAPGLVALAVSLYKLQGRHNAVRAELAKAIAHWQQAAASTTSQFSSSSSSIPASLLRAAGIELLRSPSPADHAAAAAAFTILYAADAASRINIAGLVASLASDAATPEQAERQQKLAASLTPVDQLTAGIDVAALLRNGVAQLPLPAVVVGKKRGAAVAGTAATEPPAKKTKGAAGKPAAGLSRQAKKLQAKAAAAGDDSFDVNKKLDAERWLPLRDRSSYRPPKGKKGKRRGEAATMQGGVVKEEETLALAGGAGSVRVEKAPQGPSAAAKKRKKGKK